MKAISQPHGSGLQAVILAGGYGTRLRPAIGDLPKPLALVHGQPFLQWQIAHLRDQGTRDFVLCTGYGHDLIRAHFGDGSALNVRIVYSAEREPLGTGGALAFAAAWLEDAFLVVNGDTFYGGDLGPLLAVHAEGRAPVSMGLIKVPEVDRFGAVTLSQAGYVASFAEKGCRGSGLINAGIYIFGREILGQFPARAPLSLENDVFPSLVEGQRLRGCVLQGYHMDIGTPASYLQLVRDMANGDLVEG